MQEAAAMVSEGRPDVLICLLLVICSSSWLRFVASQNVSVQECPSSCGNLTIPYPFGIGTNCAREGFDLSCNHSFASPKTFISTSTVEVLSISLHEAQARVGYGRAYDCYAKDGSNNLYNEPQAWAGDITPYTFSNIHNKFTVLGCDTYAYMHGYDDTGIRVGCDAKCSRWEQVVNDNGSCSGLGCCQVSIPKGLKYFDILVLSWDNHTKVWDFNPCGYAFLVDQDWFTFRPVDITNTSVYRRSREKVPLVLDWVAGNESCEVAKKDRDKYACRSENSVCYNSTSSATGYLCNCSTGYEGNPYLAGGCQDVNECERLDAYPCKGKCTNYEGGYNCTCPKGSHGDPKYGCIKEKKILNVILAVLLPSLVATIFIACVYGHFEKRKRFELAQKFYQQNGGTILEQHMATHSHVRSILKVFTKEELEKATDKFDDSKLLGRGGQGMVYEGTLPDNTKVAIKRSTMLKEEQINDFINEIVVLSQVNHRNVVRLLGCCLEVKIPYVVYEFVPNNTLFYHLQNKRLLWPVRLRIAADIASALAHLHTKVVVPIYHQDVKSTNILLDADYRAKVSDFGSSKFVPTDKEELNMLVQGTIGYLDPEYLETHQLTDKSDVYSFGVVLVELLTGREPLSYQRSEEERCLAKHFKLCMEHNKLTDILDPELLIVATTTIITQMRDVAKLADRCLNLKGTRRPDMLEVSYELEGAWRSGNFTSVDDQAVDETEHLLSENGLNGQGNNQSVYFSIGDQERNVSTFAIDIGR